MVRSASDPVSFTARISVDEGLVIRGYGRGEGQAKAKSVMTDQEMIQRAWSVNEAFGASDWAAFGAALADDAVYEEPATGRRTEGREANIDLAKGWKSAFPDVRGRLDQAYVSGQTVIMEITWEGTQSGPLAMPTGTLPPTGKRIRVPAVMITTLKNGKISRQRHHLDVLTMLTQLGVVPGGASR